MARISGDDVEEAKRVLRAAYYRQVSGEVADLVRAYFDGEYDDEEGQNEHLEQACESHVTYISDQYDTIYSSERSSEGAQRLAELGDGGGDPLDEQLGRWAYWTFNEDVRELLGNSYGAAVKLLEPMNEGLEGDARLIWLAEHYGTVVFDDREGTIHFYVGIVDPDTATEVDLGIVSITYADDDTHVVKSATRRSVPEKFDRMVGEHRDASMMAVLRDALLEDGFFSGRR